MDRACVAWIINVCNDEGIWSWDPSSNHKLVTKSISPCKEENFSILLYIKGAGRFVTKISLDKNVLLQDKLELSHQSFPLSSLTIGGQYNFPRKPSRLLGGRAYNRVQIYEVLLCTISEVKLSNTQTWMCGCCFLLPWRKLHIPPRPTPHPQTCPLSLDTHVFRTSVHG